MRYSRDLTGYGRTTPDPRWPGGARIAVQIVLNYEEGGENSIEHGDPASEAFLSEIIGAQPWPGQRHWNMESIYDYGARSGFWRMHRMLCDLPITVYGVATALERSPEQVAAMQEAGWEIATHGLKWIDYRNVPREVEADHAQAGVRQVGGDPPGPAADLHRRTTPGQLDHLGEGAQDSPVEGCLDAQVREQAGVVGGPA